MKEWEEVDKRPSQRISFSGISATRYGIVFNIVITDGGAQWQHYNERLLKISDSMIAYQRLMTQSNQIIRQKRLRPQLNIVQQKMFSKT